jgi:DNA-binding MarR family transcriptional regulator
MSSRESVPDVRETAERLHSAAIRLLRRLRKADGEAGLSGPQASALSVLVFGGETTLGRLAAAEQVRPPTMSRLVKELEAAGLVQRRADPADARGVRLTATRKGREVLELGRARRLRRLVAALSARPPEERRLLAEAARLLTEVADAPDLD